MLTPFKMLFKISKSSSKIFPFFPIAKALFTAELMSYVKEISLGFINASYSPCESEIS